MTNAKHTAVGDDAMKLIARSLLKERLTSVQHTAVGDDALKLIARSLL
uniref:Uncharacterized protein n=1 Tax=viral metagenome TaxID=1070528 RepID=A0A6C0L679_9ZZZZ